MIWFLIESKQDILFQNYFRRDPEDPFSVGRGDLDPFGRGPPGMMFDPMRPRGPRFGPDPSAGLPGRLPR